MNLTMFLFVLLAIASINAKKVEIKDEGTEVKGKREAPIGHYTSLGGPQTSHALQIQPLQGHGDSNAVSIGAGYSIGGGGGGGKSFGPTYGAPAQSYKYAAPQQGGAGYQELEAPHFQLPDGQKFSSLEEVMQSLRASGLKVGLPSHSSAPASLYGAPHGGSSALQSSLGGHQFALPQATYGSPKQAPITFNLQQHSSQPSYAAGIQGLGAYASGPLGSTGPQLFNPSQSSSHGASYAPSLSYGTPNSGHSIGDASQSFGDSGSGNLFGGSGYSSGGSGHSLGDSGHSSGGGSGHSFGGAGLSLGGSGHSLGDSGHSSGGGSGHSFGGAGLSLGGSGHSLGGSGHSFGGLAPYKGLNAQYGAPSTSSFKPSAFLGASVQGSHDDAFGALEHGAISADALSAGSLGAHSSLGGHGSFGGSSFGSGQSYLPPSEGSSSGHAFGSSLGSLQLGSAGHSSSPPGTSYGIPSGSYGLPSNNHGSSSNNYYQLSSKNIPQSYSTPSFGHSSQSYSAPSTSHSSLSSSPSFGHGSHSYSSPSSGHSSLSSPSFGHGHSSSSPGLSYHSSPSSSYGTPRDNHGDHSMPSYNTIKYSRDLTSKKM